MSSLKKRRHEGNMGAGRFACKTEHVHVARVLAGARFGDKSDQQKQIKSILSLP